MSAVLCFLSVGKTEVAECSLILIREKLAMGAANLGSLVEPKTSASLAMFPFPMRPRWMAGASEEGMVFGESAD